MLFEKWLLPDLCLPGYGALTPEFCLSHGFTHIVSDIDNTLVTYDDAEPTEELRIWLRQMRENGLEIAFLSNNKPPRVERFNRTLGYIAHADAGKPGGGALRTILDTWQCAPESVLFLGDQLLTDAACGKRAGLYTVIVPPIHDRTDWFHRMKRRLEKPYIRKYHRLHPSDAAGAAIERK